MTKRRIVSPKTEGSSPSLHSKKRQGPAPPVPVQARPDCPTCAGDGEVCEKCGKRAIYCECYLKQVVGWVAKKCKCRGGK